MLWPLVGSPGSAVVPVAADPLAPGEGELSARVDMAVRTTKAGMPTARRSARATRIEPNHIQARSRQARRGIPAPPAGTKSYGFLLAVLGFRLLLRHPTLARREIGAPWLTALLE